MSIHKSLKVKSGLVRARNVWTRVERLEALKKAGKYGEGDSVYGLPKVRTQLKTKKKPAKKQEADEAAGAPAAGKPAEAKG
jgi:small basic protein (TIGR04137 family)